jgi:outer membrane protein assembly factor BamA
MPEFVGEENGHEMLDVTLMLKEKAVRTYDADFEWSLNSLHRRLPIPVPGHLVPGGFLNYEDRNILGKGDIINATVHCSSFWHPSDDMQLRVLFRRPYIFGEGKGREEDLVLDAFNARRLSSVFTASGAAAQTVPPVWIERAGLKAGLDQHLTRHSKSNIGLIAQQIKTRDDTNALVTHGQKLGPRGEVMEDGPPTTLSGTGVDRSIHGQLSVLRDTTFSENGGLVGSRDMLEVNQGLGLGNGFFNRCCPAIAITAFVAVHFLDRCLAGFVKGRWSTCSAVIDWFAFSTW